MYFVASMTVMSYTMYHLETNSLRNSERRKEEGGNIRDIVNMTYWYFKCQALINEGIKVIT